MVICMSMVENQRPHEGRLSVTDWNWIRLAPVVLVSLVSLSLSGKTSEVVAETRIVQDYETLEWMDDYDEAIALAKETGKPVFLEFRCSP